ncbi:hypothetical protein PY365_20070 [Roseiarcaceae bacterium H3SJ34-1]|nr:hypothetical protein [Roseiarcaceae bacterium H3SJ34-1]
MDLDTNQRERLRQAHVKIVQDPVERLIVDDDRIMTIHREVRDQRFDILYSAWV